MKITIADLMKMPHEAKVIEDHLNNFCTLTGLAAVITDVGGANLSEVINISDYCKVRRQEGKGCVNSDSKGSSIALSTGDTHIYTCHAGVIDLAMPIMVKGKYQGSIMAGQVRLKGVTEALPDEKDLRHLYLKIPYMDQEQLEMAAKVLEILRKYIVERIENLTTMGNQGSPGDRLLEDFVSDIGKSLQILDYQGGLELLDHFIDALCERQMENQVLGSVKKKLGEAFEALDPLFAAKEIQPELASYKHRMSERRPWCQVQYLYYYAYYELVFHRLLDHRVFRVQEVFDYVTAYTKCRYDEKITVRDMADYVSLSPDYFARRFKKLHGVTYLEYLTSVRLEAAKEHLIMTDMNISEIGHATGFGDGNYFARIFRRELGISPKAFRSLYGTGSQVMTSE